MRNLTTLTFLFLFSILPTLLNAQNCNRATIIADYNTNYGGSTADWATLGWTGNVTGCVRGDISPIFLANMLQRTNYYRKLCGLTTNVVFDATNNSKCQAAALMFTAEGRANHCRPEDGCAGYTCTSADGILGAQSSNVFGGGFNPLFGNPIDVWINDSGGGNEFVGHRRWILYSMANEMGFGSSPSNALMWAFPSNPVAPAHTNFIAFPTVGYMPRNLINKRFSFGIPGADFANATATVTKTVNGVTTPVTVTLHPLIPGFGDNTLTWDIPVAELNFPGTTDVRFNVTISGVLIGGNPVVDYNYAVIAIDPTANATLTAAPTLPNCPMTNGAITTTFPPGGTYLWNDGITTANRTNLANGTYMVTVTDANGCTQSTTIDLQCAGALPVELISFTGQSKEGAIVLNWTTETETDNKYFTLERSKDGELFETLSTIPGAGESLTPLDYRYVDRLPFPGLNYYRLSQYDLDGKRSVNKTIAIDYNTEIAIRIYPNPIESGPVTIDYFAPQNGQMQIEIIDISGNIILSSQIEVSKGENRFALPSDQLTSGVYFVKTLQDRISKTFRLVKQN